MCGVNWFNSLEDDDGPAESQQTSAKQHYTGGLRHINQAGTPWADSNKVALGIF